MFFTLKCENPYWRILSTQTYMVATNITQTGDLCASLAENLMVRMERDQLLVISLTH